MTDIFISYSRHQIEFAQTLFKTLETDQFDAWLDQTDIPLTSDWWQEIREGIEGADNFAFIMTPSSVISAVCMLELAHAREQNKRIIPILREKPDEEATFEAIKKIQPDAVLVKMLDGRDLSQIARDNWHLLHQLNWIAFRQNDDFDVAVDRLKVVLATDLAHVKLHTRLLVEAIRWKDNQTEISRLLSGEELDEAENWLQFNADKEPNPTDDHRHLIAASQAEREQQKQRAIRRRNITLTISVVVAIITSLLALVAVVASNDATRNLLASRTTQSLFLADLSRQELERGQPQNALLLALESLAHYDEIFNPESKTALVYALNAPVEELASMIHETEITVIDGQINGAAWSPDESRILSWSSERMWLWTSDGQPITSLFNGRQLMGARWNADGSQILAWGAGVSLWDAATAEIIHVFPHSNTVYGAVYNSDESNIMLWGRDGTVRVWYTDTGRERHRLPHNDAVEGATWNRDETRILSWSRDGSARIWNVESITNFRLTTLQHEGIVEGAAWSPDESRILAWVRSSAQTNAQGQLSFTSEKNAVIWDANTGERIFELEHNGDLHGARWNRAGTRILTVPQGNEIHLWDAINGEDIEVFGHNTQVQTAAWGRDDTTILTVSEDAAWLWRADGVLLWRFSHDSKLLGAKWNKTYTRLITWAADDTIRIWKVSDGTLENVLADSGAAGGVTLNGAEDRLLTWQENVLKVWSLKSQHEPVADDLPVLDLIQLANGRVKRPLSNEERLLFFLPTTTPTPILPTLTPAPDATPVQFIMLQDDVRVHIVQPEGERVGGLVPESTPAPLLAVNSVIATQVSSSHNNAEQRLGSIHLDLSDLENQVRRQLLDNSIYADFTIRTNAFWGGVAGQDGCGLAFRYVDGNNYYVVYADRNGSLNFAARIDGAWDISKRVHVPEIVDTDLLAQNEIIIIATGDTYSVFVNGNYVTQFSDGRLLNGRIGVIGWVRGEKQISYCAFTDTEIIPHDRESD